MGYHTTMDTLQKCPNSVQNSEFQLLLTLAALVDDKTRGWWIHIQHLADLAHMSRSTAIRSMQVLCDLGVIIRHRENRKKPYTYRIVEYDKVGQETSTFLGRETFNVESPEPPLPVAPPPPAPVVSAPKPWRPIPEPIDDTHRFHLGSCTRCAKTFQAWERSGKTVKCAPGGTPAPKYSVCYCARNDFNCPGCFPTEVEVEA